MQHLIRTPETAAEGCGTRRAEVFIEGSEPTASCCSAANRNRLALPYPFHRFDLTGSGALRVPVDELERLLRTEAMVELDDSGDLMMLHPDGALRIPLVRQPRIFRWEALGTRLHQVRGAAARMAGWRGSC